MRLIETFLAILRQEAEPKVVLPDQEREEAATADSGEDLKRELRRQRSELEGEHQ